MKEREALHKVKYKKKFADAARGLRVFWMTTSNLPIYILISITVIFAGFYFCISGLEWVAIIFAIALVFISEAFNTAIEIDIDLTSPEYHPYARDTKDVAAAAVLLAALAALVVGLTVFLPKIL